MTPAPIVVVIELVNSELVVKMVLLVVEVEVLIEVVVVVGVVVTNAVGVGVVGAFCEHAVRLTIVAARTATFTLQTAYNSRAGETRASSFDMAQVKTDCSVSLRLCRDDLRNGSSLACDLHVFRGNFPGLKQEQEEQGEQ